MRSIQSRRTGAALLTILLLLAACANRQVVLSDGTPDTSRSARIAEGISDFLTLHIAFSRTVVELRDAGILEAQPTNDLTLLNIQILESMQALNRSVANASDDININDNLSTLQGALADVTNLVPEGTTAFEALSLVRDAMNELLQFRLPEPTIQ